MPETNLLLPAIANRWSPRTYADKPIDPETLATLFEAARWAASCFGEEPWRFVIATKADPEKFAQVLNLLVPFNQDWAKNAYVVGITVAKKTFTKNGNPNRFNLHDAGAALATLAIQASALGLQAHGMGGFDAQKARTEFGVPDDFEIGAAFAVGYVNGSAAPPEGRTRKPLSELVFTPTWGEPAL